MDSARRKQLILKRDDFLKLTTRFNSVGEIRFIHCCLIGVDQKELLNSTEYYPVDVDSYAEKSGLSLGQAFTEIVEIINNFKHTDINITLDDGSVWVTSLVYDYIYDDAAKVIKIKWNKKVIPALSGEMLPGTYCYYDPRLDTTSNSRSFRLAELIQRHLWEVRVKGKCSISVQTIREHTDTFNIYPEYKELNRCVIQAALEDLQKYAGIKLVATKKRGSSTVIFSLARKMNALPDDTAALEIGIDA